MAQHGDLFRDKIKVTHLCSVVTLRRLAGTAELFPSFLSSSRSFEMAVLSLRWDTG